MHTLLPTATTTEEHQRAARIAVLPIGSHEQHGPCLPLATDTVIAATIAGELAAAHPVRLLPALPISCSQEHADWPGTVSISARTLDAFVRDVAASLPEIAGLVLVNGHGGNYVLGNTVQESANLALFPSPLDWARAHEAAGVLTHPDEDMHAGERETSILLHAHPELVRPGYETTDHLSERKHMPTLGLRPYTESGVIGRPSLASAEKGAALLASLVESFAEYLELFS
ncbi:creatininase family protein [Sciscionella sediminilitoris]|uniref:creatininase family protein n=1 Tax=Sciscionella sediminilitoris TaxID=1445613 RepID=UPI0004DF2C92|nr:creatininase family protein [Sciscionella sp. SE31]